MTKIYKRALFILLILLASASNSQAITKAQFLGRLLEARGIDWSESPEYQAGNPAAFILRTGYVTDTVTNLTANVTRREVLRWCIESLGLSFEANLLADYPSGFKDVQNFTPFEKGCLVVASNMTPILFSKDDKFRGSSPLSDKEFNVIMERVMNASRNLKLDMVRNPIAGLRVFIHREGVPTGIPGWRVYLDGIRTRPAADVFKKSLQSEGIEASITTPPDGLYGVRTAKLEDYNQVRRLEVIAKARGLTLYTFPVMTNTNTHILPRFWVTLRIDPSYWKIAPLASRNGPKELSTLMQICDTHQSKAAINAGFFAVINTTKGYPIGALKVNGNVINQPYDGRGCLAWNENDEAVFSVASEELNNWYDMSNIIQAGPLLINEGMPSNIDEGFNNSFLSTRHPRSVVGLTQNGEWIFMVVDGRNGMHSSGATISELTEILRTQRIPYALNLDGGGSTEIIIDGRIYNSPSDVHERRISYALGVVPVE